MIQIYNDEEKIVIKIDYMYPANGFYHVFNSVEDNKVNAALSAQNLHEHLRQTVERIRREEYESGYKDARAKRKKKPRFSQILK